MLVCFCVFSSKVQKEMAHRKNYPVTFVTSLRLKIENGGTTYFPTFPYDGDKNSKIVIKNCRKMNRNAPLNLPVSTRNVLTLVPACAVSMLPALYRTTTQPADVIRAMRAILSLPAIESLQVSSTKSGCFPPKCQASTEPPTPLFLFA